MTAPKQEERPNRDRTHSSRWGTWLAGGLAIAANVLGVVEIATTAINRPILSLIAGTLAIVGGGVWLWRISDSGYSLRARRQIIVLNVVMVVIGAGLIGFVAADRLRGQSPHHTQADGPDPTLSASSAVGTSPSNPATTNSPSAGPTHTPPALASASAPPPRPGLPPRGEVTSPKTVPTTAGRPPDGPFTGTIQITYPRYGWNLGSGDDLSGNLTQWRSGHQIWMSARPDGTSDELVQGPCQVSATAFVCQDVQLPGASGTLELIRIAVVTDQTAADLSGSSTLPVSTAPASDWTHIYKG